MGYLLFAGHCRLKAAMMACDEDHDITILCVEIKEDEIGCELATIDGNRGLALSPVCLASPIVAYILLLAGHSNELLNVKIKARRPSVLLSA